MTHKHTSRGWSHDSSHFHFHRQSPYAHRNLPFVEDGERPSSRGAAVAGIATVIAVVLGGALVMEAQDREAVRQQIAAPSPVVDVPAGMELAPQVVAQRTQP